MNLKFLGTTASIPDLHEDSPCFTVDDKYLFDCGFNVLGALRETGSDLSKIRYIIFTHMHHDHYIGLAGLLFYFIHSRVLSIKDLVILGPAADVERVAGLTYDFLQLDHFYPQEPRPTVVPLRPGDVYETEDAIITAGLCTHPVDARCYRLAHKDGSTLAITGDTTYREDMIPLFRDADALIHDSTLGAIPGMGNNGHSTIFESVRMAEKANIPVLFPVHMAVEKAKRAAQEAQTGTHVNIIPPQKGICYTVEKK